jgi:hypothetical protein
MGLNMGMLKAHIDEIERVLLATAKIPANTGHSLHKGTPRESFIKNFLTGHLSERVAIGTGEIIDADSMPGQPRNQIDIVIYKRDYPKLDFGGGVNGFLAESVVGTIEVKSTLNKDELQKATISARNIKALSRHTISAFTAGYQPPGIMSYVVAYDGPASMSTVHGWLPDVSLAPGVVYPDLPFDDHSRTQITSPALDAVFVLGRGFMHFGNAPIGFFNAKCLEQNPHNKWVIVDAADGNLLLLFLFLSFAVSGTSGSWLDAGPYLKDFRVFQLRLGT